MVYNTKEYAILYFGVAGLHFVTNMLQYVTERASGGDGVAVEACFAADR